MYCFKKSVKKLNIPLKISSFYKLSMQINSSMFFFDEVVIFLQYILQMVKHFHPLKMIFLNLFYFRKFN